MGQKILGQKKFGLKKNFGSKKIVDTKKFLVKKLFWVKIFFGSNLFFMTPPPESSRVKIVLDCCWYCWLSLPTKFHTPRIIIFGRSRVCVVGWVGGGVK